MQNTVKTTIRIKKDLLNQSRLLALAKGTSVQAIINEILTIGYKHVTDFRTVKEAMKQIDTFRSSMEKKVFQ